MLDSVSGTSDNGGVMSCGFESERTPLAFCDRVVMTDLKVDLVVIEDAEEEETGEGRDICDWLIEPSRSGGGSTGQISEVIDVEFVSSVIWVGMGCMAEIGADEGAGVRSLVSVPSTLSTSISASAPSLSLLSSSS